MKYSHAAVGTMSPMPPQSTNNLHKNLSSQVKTISDLKPSAEGNVLQTQLRPVAKVKQSEPTMRQYLLDPPNVITMFGLLFSTYSIYNTMIGNLRLSCAFMMWSTFADFYDGWVARRLGPAWGRTDKHRALGAELDSLVDVINFTVCPALVTLKYSEFSPYVVPVLAVYLACGVLRLAYYNTHGLQGMYYTGLSVDTNAPIFTLVFMTEQFSPSRSAFVALLCLTHLALAWANTSTMPVYKIGCGGNHEFFPFTGLLFLIGCAVALV